MSATQTTNPPFKKYFKMKELNDYLLQLNSKGIRTKLFQTLNTKYMTLYWYAISKNGKFTESIFVIRKDDNETFEEFTQDNRLNETKLKEYFAKFNGEQSEIEKLKYA